MQWLIDFSCSDPEASLSKYVSFKQLTFLLFTLLIYLILNWCTCGYFVLDIYFGQCYGASFLRFSALFT